MRGDYSPLVMIQEIPDPLTIAVVGGYAFVPDSFPENSSFTGTEDVASYLFTAITRTQPTMPIVLLVERHEADVNMRKSASQVER
jgi:hypothetical protein